MEPYWSEKDGRTAKIPQGCAPMTAYDTIVCVTETSCVQTNVLEREKENYTEKKTEMMQVLNSQPYFSSNFQWCNTRNNINYVVLS
jgi:hypothetical protein